MTSKSKLSMLKRTLPKLSLLFSVLLAASAVFAQPNMLIVDRAASAAGNQPLGLAKDANNFLADDFQAGATGEDWVIDHIRLWAIPDPKAPSSSAQHLGDMFQKISLYGGIAPDLPPANQPPTPECDCHNLPALKTATLEPGADTPKASDITISAKGQHDLPDTWQIDFENLSWSVPGGTPIQFGVLGEPRPGNGGFTYFNLGYAGEGQHLRLFSSIGKIEHAVDDQGPARMYIQVWAHMLARVNLRTAGQKFRVILRNEHLIPADQVDPSSLRFGPSRATPTDAHIEDVDHDGKPALVMYVNKVDAGLGANNVNACLTGKRNDGAPFEGCDLLPH
jgi:hypothetical protein